MAGRGRTPLAMRGERLKAANEVLLPFLRAAGLQRRLLRLAGRPPTRVLHLTQTRDYTVTIIVYTLPLGNPLVLALYTSAQRSRPLSPAQLRRKLERLRAETMKLHGKHFNQADVLYAIQAPAGLTAGARRAARRLGVNTAKTPKELITRLARYAAKRHQKLLEKIRGRRIWGPLPLLLHALAALAKALGAPTTTPPLEETIRLAESGGTITA